MAKATRMTDGSAAGAARISAGKAAAAVAIFKALRRVIHGCNDGSRIGSPLIRNLSSIGPSNFHARPIGCLVTSNGSASAGWLDHETVLPERPPPRIVSALQDWNAAMGSIFNPDRRSMVAAGRRVADPSPSHRRYHHPDFDRKGLQGWRAVHREAALPQTAWKVEREWAIRMGLAGADSIEDRGISTFARGELPHYAGINTFLKAPYVENVRDVGKYDAAILGVPFDGGTTFRPGTRFGPQGIRRISALYTPYNFEIGVDLREQMTMCDLGDVFTIPANLEKTFDQISRAVAHVFSQGALPVILGGDHSIGFPTMRGIAQCTSRRIGIIHFDRHADIQEKDLDERMHTTPWFHATNLPNVPASNLVQIGIGGWQVPRDAIAVARERDTTIITMSDVEKLGIDKVAEIALEIAWKDADAVYMSFDIDCVDCGFVPGTGWPEPGGFLPREALGLVGRVAKEGLCGMEIVEVSPPYDTSDITALFATRVIVDALGAIVANGKLGAHKPVIDKPVVF